MKEQILKLRSEGKTYTEIQNLLNCSKGTINYHCSKNGKVQTKRRRNKNCRNNLNTLKQSLGGRCKICGYSRCSNALEFHHLDPLTKDRKYNGITAMLRNCSIQKAKEELRKCILLCAICHREFHSDFIDIEGNIMAPQ